jgi:8-oxo-dGTP diphosphatase
MAGHPLSLRAEIEALVAGIEPHDALEAEHRAFALTWIGSGAPLFRVQKPGMPDPHLVSYFPVVDALAGKLLLVDHRNSGLWLPAGGHVEPDEHPRVTVEREAREELDVGADLVLPVPLFITVTQTRELNPAHTDVALWYLLRGDASRPLAFDSGEFHGVRWFLPNEVPYERAEPHLARFLSKLSERRLLHAPGCAAEAWGRRSTPAVRW